MSEARFLEESLLRALGRAYLDCQNHIEAGRWQDSRLAAAKLQYLLRELRAITTARSPQTIDLANVAPSTLPKLCGVCQTLYETPEAWAALVHAGDQYVPADAYGPATRTEMRNCPCGATLAIDYEEP